MTHYRRLPLKTLKNARDLGGYPTSSGSATAFGQFIRCEAPCCLDASDLAFLRGYGVASAVDFRGDREVTSRPSDFERLDWIDYHRQPTFNAQVAAFAARDGRADPKTPPVTAFVDWGEKYIDMAETCRDWVADTLNLMAALSESGGVMFSCTTGKDRTGIISALLLAIAGVGEEDVVADYCVSELYLTEAYTPLLAEYNRHFTDGPPATLRDPFFRTAPENMAALLGHFRREYGGAAGYVVSCGVRDDAVAQLRRKICGYGNQNV
jgi:protein-tyrosine phosphatase